MSQTNHFRFAIDRGGTFTDIYAELPGNQGYKVLKLLSEDPDNYDDAPREGIRRILEEYGETKITDDQLDSEQIEWIRMGTTVATNALLERKGERSALLITKGFRDLLRIGYQNRPSLFDLEIKKPELLYETVLEVDERVRLLKKDEEVTSLEIVETKDGEKIEIIKRPEIATIRQQLQSILDRGIKSLAVVLIHSYLFLDHERMIGELALEMGFSQVSLSSEVMPMIKMVARGDTTTVDAYLTPHIRNYLQSFRSGFKDQLNQTRLLVMQSDGGLVPSNKFKGSNAILSGPAGGVVGYALTTCYYKKEKPIIGFDMGGTSTDVSRFDGEYDLTHETETAGVRIQAPQLNINTVAAGGGSRLFFENGMFVVGPESAGAHPGPICYRKNGYLTVTDANLFLGRLQPDFFPNIFGPTGDQPLDLKATQQAFEEITETINQQNQIRGIALMSPEEVALGFLKVANEAMTRPIREISVMRGYDSKEHILACFGGAGGQHACSIAADLGISEIMIHRFGGILSAYGMGLADIVSEQQEPSSLEYSSRNRPVLQERLRALAEKAGKELIDQGLPEETITVQNYLNLRYRGTDRAMMLLEPEDGDYDSLLRDSWQREYGFDLSDRRILVDDIRVRAIGKASDLENIPLNAKGSSMEPEQVSDVFFEEGWMKTPIYRVEKLSGMDPILGPAILIQNTSTIVIEPDCQAVVNTFGDIEIKLLQEHEVHVQKKVDTVQLSIFSHLFMSIAEQMGRSLQRTAVSTNIKERQDFSCAIFDRKGGLVANAPHQPVHLGAMGEAVRRQIELQGKKLKEGDVLLTNHPVSGGSHLPDLTVVTPVWKNGEPVFYVASRGHHADIGGVTPGSMPPFSKTLDDEGVSFKSFKLVEHSLFQEERVHDAFRSSRVRSDNVSDLKAQIAANQKGIDLLREMVKKYSLEVVQAYMEYIQDNAANAVRTMLRAFSEEQGLKEVDTIETEEFMDDGTPIHLKLTIDRNKGTAFFDFTGTGREVWGNWNAPKAVTKSAILYCLRCLIRKDIPLNQGCLEPITIRLREGTLLAPSEEAAVVGGNVLTSQRITDVVFKAFGQVAASQGCMNNLTFGNRQFAYYETIAGGAGAGNGWHGQSGVHTHMTNTRITDPEVLEKRYPVLLREFSLRINSGGEGKFRGGDGILREIEFLKPLEVSILSERRVFPPYGMKGGEPGAKGENLLIRENGTEINLGGKNTVHMEPGDRIRIKTPGGGGFGK